MRPSHHTPVISQESFWTISTRHGSKIGQGLFSSHGHSGTHGASCKGFVSDCKYQRLHRVYELRLTVEGHGRLLKPSKQELTGAHGPWKSSSSDVSWSYLKSGSIYIYNVHYIKRKRQESIHWNWYCAFKKYLIWAFKILCFTAGLIFTNVPPLIDLLNSHIRGEQSKNKLLIQALSILLLD